MPICAFLTWCKKESACPFSSQHKFIVCQNQIHIFNFDFSCFIGWQFFSEKTWQSYREVCCISTQHGIKAAMTVLQIGTKILVKISETFNHRDRGKRVLMQPKACKVHAVTPWAMSQKDTKTIGYRTWLLHETTALWLDALQPSCLTFFGERPNFFVDWFIAKLVLDNFNCLVMIPDSWEWTSLKTIAKNPYFHQTTKLRLILWDKNMAIQQCTKLPGRLCIIQIKSNCWKIDLKSLR